jgi:sec-independent protein translocase protein TatB
MNLDPAKLLVVLVIALIVVGPERLPKMARQFGQIWSEVLAARERVVRDIKAQVPDLPELPRMPSVRSTLFAPAATTTAPIVEQRSPSRTTDSPHMDNACPDRDGIATGDPSMN